MARKIRDHYAPKRSVSAFVHYQNAIRDSIRSRFPGIGVSDFAKLTSDMYEQLPYPEKLAWESCAVADKHRFNNEMEHYEPPPGYDAKGNATIENQEEKRRLVPDNSRAQKLKPSSIHTKINIKQYSGTRKAAIAIPVLITPAPVKFASMGKHAINDKKEADESQISYKVMRNEFERPSRDFTFTQAFHLMTPEEKTQCEEQAHGKGTYNLPTPQNQDPLDFFSVNAHATRKRGRPKKKKDKNAPKRCRTSFVLYASEERPKIIREFPGVSFVEMGSILGKRWRSRSAEDSTTWEQKAAEDKSRYFQQMDLYKAGLNATTSSFNEDQTPVMNEKACETTPNVASPFPVSGYSNQFMQLPYLPYALTDSQLFQGNSRYSINSDNGNFYLQGLQSFEPCFSV